MKSYVTSDSENLLTIVFSKIALNYTVKKEVRIFTRFKDVHKLQRSIFNFPKIWIRCMV